MIYTKEYWNLEWASVFEHYQQDIRHGHYIHAVLRPDEKKILELGAGSFRDASLLNRLGLECWGVDYSTFAVDSARKLYPQYAERFHVANILKMDFPDNSFDFSYSNGVVGCFNNDDIKSIFKEQCRITRKRIAVTVHNRHNQQFWDYFQKKKQEDPLYAVRFFLIDEISDILKQFCTNITIIPVGKQKKYFEDDLINIGLSDPVFLKKSFDYHRLNLLDVSERLLCLGEV